MNNAPPVCFPTFPMFVDSGLVAKWIAMDVDFRIANLNSGYLLIPPAPPESLISSGIQGELFDPSQALPEQQ